jgi:hypothetical protein
VEKLDPVGVQNRFSEFNLSANKVENQVVEKVIWMVGAWLVELWVAGEAH